MTFHRFLPAVLFILLTESVGLIGGYITASAIPTWYASLEKPSFVPPDALFGPVWIILYALMGTAAYLIYDKARQTKRGKTALLLFGIQLFLNGLWTILFFGLRMPVLAFVEIIFLWIFILFTTIQFFRIASNAGLLFLPYLLWVAFAAVLNFTIVILN